LDGLRIIDVSNPSSPVEIAVFNTEDCAYDVMVVSNRAYVADRQGLQVVDVSNPANPSNMGWVATSGHAWNLFVTNNLAYVADGIGGLWIIDVSEKDGDQDGLPDTWERRYWGNLGQTGTDDYDNDGLNNLNEYNYGGNPTDSDTDDDGMTDYQEVLAGTNLGDPASRFEIFNVAAGADDSTFAFEWTSVTSRNYCVRTTTNLLIDWVNVSDVVYTNISGTGGPIVYTNRQLGAPSRFFSVVARPKP
jgi:hypothetical protein